MIASLVLAVSTLFAVQQAPGAWTWTLYQDSPLVLAEEIPDSPDLRATFECEPGSGVARATLYGPAAPEGMARLTAGEASAVAETQASRDGALKFTVRSDHPVFAAFVAEGRLAVAVGEQRRAVDVPADHRPKLRRFAELCGA